MNTWDVAWRLFLSIVCGGLIGWERQRHHKPAGFRTHILVSMGSALFMLVSIFIHEEFKADGGPSDPGRIAAQVVTGIGFLGAGTIWMSQNMVRGLTTAASLWALAGIGLAIGSGFYSAGLMATAAILIVLRVLQALEDMWGGPPPMDSNHTEFPPPRGSAASSVPSLREGAAVPVERPAGLKRKLQADEPSSNV